MKKTTLAALAGALTLAAGVANAESSSTDNQCVEMQGQKCVKTKAAEGKCGEGKCGAATPMKAAEGKCGEGKCGATEAKQMPATKATEGKCGEGKCGTK